MLANPGTIVERLKHFQAQVRDVIRRAHTRGGAAAVARDSAADTIYGIDTAVEPLLEAFCEEWSREVPLVLVAEGLLDEAGRDAERRVFPRGTREEDAAIRVIVDPIDGTRGIMYDKRAAWALAGVAPNKGPGTRLRDIEVAVMTELPTSKMGAADVLWAIKGRGAAGERIDLATGQAVPLNVAPSRAPTIAHGFASVANFFPATKVLASALMEYLVERLVGKADVTRATVFDDQYISTGGQFYELIVGHDRFNADLRPAFYAMQGQAAGLCCHPYDCAALLVAEEAGVIITDVAGKPLDGPLDTTTGLNWVGYANGRLRAAMEPLILEFLQSRPGPGRVGNG